MDTIVQWWVQKGSPATQAFRSVSTHLAAKRSQPYSPTGLYDFMHNKVLVCDDIVATGSFNLSGSATQNAENSLIVHDPALADRYVNYIDVLVQQYGR